jgi:transcriptional regulator with XRE-family HTH domain
MAIHKWRDLEAKIPADRRTALDKRVEKTLLEMNLQALRDELGKTQAEVAAAAEMTQGEMSRAERRDDHLVSTLRRIVEALGGRLEVIADFGDRKVRLTGV